MSPYIIRSALRVSTSCLLFATLALAGAAQKTKAAGDAAKGKQVFEQCIMCHAVDTNETRMGAPSLKGLYKRPKLRNGKPVTDANVLDQINKGGNGMPPYADLLSPQEKTDLIAYLRTL